ncbi:MAG: TAXI family TRAP transporter solute-binding subunit [Pseudomonadota bacterium]
MRTEWRRDAFCRALNVAVVPLSVLLLFFMLSFGAYAQQRRTATPQEAATKERVNQNTVGIVAGKSDSASLAIAEDLTNVLDDGNNFRVLALVGKGAAQNVRDVLNLRNIDLGITQANVLAYFKKTGELGAGIENRLVYITKLYNEEVHIVARSDVGGIADLAGKTVNFGEQGSGTELSARLVFEALGVNVRSVSLPQADALHAIKAGDIAATVLLTGKPSDLLARLRNEDGTYKLLSIPFEEALEKDYLPTSLTSEDYPALIHPGEPVESIAVPAILAAYNWPESHDRHRRLAQFTEAFFAKFQELRRAPRHPKWREVNLLSEVPGWQRFPVAQKWLEANTSERARAAGAAASSGNAAQKKLIEQFIAAQRKAAGNAGPVDAAAEQAMLEKFLEWMGTQGSGAAQPSAAVPPARVPAPTSGTPAPSGPRLW